VSSVDTESIERLKADVVEAHGPWTAHNIHLGGDAYTIVKALEGGNEFRLRRVVQIVSDVAPTPLEELRVVDLGCLEGLFAIELARRGATVLGIEGREANIEKARFARTVLSLDELELTQDDLRAFSAERYGEFDVVLCLGVLYHFEASALFRFVGEVARACTGFAVIESHVSLTPRERRVHGGRVYWGSAIEEPVGRGDHDPQTLWAGLGNPTSFMLTRASLCNLLLDSGFTSVMECHVPAESEMLPDWLTLVAFKGRPQDLLSAPLLDREALVTLPERSPRRAVVEHVRARLHQRVYLRAINSRYYRVLKRISPRAVRARAKKLLR
jgi:SAM-dependent methyltransferase